MAKSAESVHQQMIRENRVYLVEKIDLLQTCILDKLAQEQVLSVKQLTSIKDKYSANSQAVSALLDHLDKRPQEDWDKFLKCLSDQRHQYVVDHLKASTSVRKTSSSVLRIQKKMAGIIQHLYSKASLWTLHSDHHRIPMDKIYVNIVLVKDKHHPHGKQEHLGGYRDIFKKSGCRSTIYLSGEPGVGKSTFTQHLSVEWAKSHDKGTELDKEVNDMFKNFQFVLPLFLRDVKNGQSLCDLFAEVYQLGQSEAEELHRLINDPNESILIIADGLDEYSESTSTDITNLLHRQILPHIILFITSRFSPESFFAEDKLRPDTELSLLGFSEAGVKEYLLKFFNQNEEKRDTLLEEIKKSDGLVHLSRYPAILLMMATLGKESQNLPRTITGFYEEFVAYVFGRLEKKWRKVSDRAKSTEEILKRYNTQIMALGCLAAGNVKAHKLELEFKRTDVDKYISSGDLKTGFLIEKLTSSREIFYIFIHKTMQEYFIAFYLVYSDKSTQQELLLQFFDARKAFTESAMIRRFVSGLGGQTLYEKLEKLIKGTEWEVAEMHTDLQLEYLAEHPDVRFTLPRGVKLNMTHKYPASHYIKFMSQDGGEVRKMWVRTGDEIHWRLPQQFHAPQLDSLVRDWWLRPRHSVEKQYISQTPCEYNLIQKFPPEQLTVYSVIGDRIKTLTEWLPRSHLTSLRMSNCDLVSQETVAVLNVLPPSLKTLNISYNNLRGLTDTDQLSGVTRSHIHTLDISRCELTPRGILSVIEAAPKTLTYLNLSENCRWKEGDDLVKVAEWTTRLDKLKTLNLQRLLMSHCYLTSAGVLAVLDAAPETLLDLDASGNCFRGESDDLVKVTERTTRLNKLNTLNFDLNHMSLGGMTLIKHKLAETCPHLKLSIDNQGYTCIPVSKFDTDSYQSLQADNENVQPEEADSENVHSVQTDTDNDESVQTDRLFS